MSLEKKLKVFISYKWENENHQKKVETFAGKLKDNGFDVKLDVYQDSKDTDNTDWRLWIDKELPTSDFILIICTKNYKNCFDNNVDCKGEGGVQYEARHIRNKIEDNIIFPILFNQDDKKYIPHLMKSFNRYELINESFDIQDNNSAYNMLIRKLSNQPKYLEPKIGKIPKLLPESKIDGVNDKERTSYKSILLMSLLFISIIGVGILIEKHFFSKGETNFTVNNSKAVAIAQSGGVVNQTNITNKYPESSQKTKTFHIKIQENYNDSYIKKRIGFYEDSDCIKESTEYLGINPENSKEHLLEFESKRDFVKLYIKHNNYGCVKLFFKSSSNKHTFKCKKDCTLLGNKGSIDCEDRKTKGKCEESN